MEDFKFYLDKIGEVGFVEEVVHSIVYVSGIPQSHPTEVVVFESGDIGQVMSISKDQVEVLLLSKTQVRVGAQVARTGRLLQVEVGKNVLGRIIDPLGRPHDGGGVAKKAGPGESELRAIDIKPQNMLNRQPVVEPFETGVSIVDLVVPLGKGQRELVIGDRKTGKTEFLLQTIMTQAARGTICIYAAIAQKNLDIKRLFGYFNDSGIKDQTVIVASKSEDPSGLIFLTPYTAMTIAEFFRDKGMDVLVILDDMSGHARYYREISLLARRFPGRSAYPGDIFYVHARLIERAGNFKKGSITCLPLAESIMGDLSGYIQTNLMAMTDGHIYFDIELYNQGKRPSVSPFLSVTRVGHQTQTPLEKDISRELSSFLVNYERMKTFLHFGTEVSESVRRTLDLGKKLDLFFNQPAQIIIPINVNILLIGALWAGLWNEIKAEDMKLEMINIANYYKSNQNYKGQIDTKVKGFANFSQLIDYLRQDDSLVQMVRTATKR
jgi:F-type H+-transporting ATPase subunit alpha